MALYIQLTSPKENEIIYFPDRYFEIYFKSEWMYSDFTKKVVETIDKATLTAQKGYNYSLNDEFGFILDPFRLSTGTKLLLMLYHLDLNKHTKFFKLSNMGENCYPFLEEIAQNKDITLYGSCLPWGKLSGIIKESNVPFTTKLEFIEERGRLIDEGVIEDD